MNKRKSLGEKLRELRESYDLSQNQVADALSIHRSTYTNYELDKTRPTLEMLVKLAHIYNVPKEQLLPEDDGDAVTFKDVARADSMLKTLSKEERGLIVYFRALDKDKQTKLLEQVAKLSKKES